MGLLALITPAFLVIPLMIWMRRIAELPRVRSAIRGLLLAAAGLLISSSMPLTQDALSGEGPVLVFSFAILAASFGLLTFTRISSAWLMVGAAALGLLSLVFR